MRILRICVSLVACVVIGGSVCLAVFMTDRNKAPQIACSVETLEVPVAVTDEELLGYVTATDPEDGDLTGSVILERGNYFRSPGESWVTYSVCDSHNAVTVLEKKILFTDYHAPRIHLKSDLIFSSGTTENLTEYVRATDLFDGDISGQVKLISTEFTYLPGTYKVNIKVTNSMGDTRDLTVDTIVTDEDYKETKIRLSDYIIYIKPGEKPAFKNYIRDVSNGYSSNSVVVDDSAFVSETAGVYNVYYTIQKSGKTVAKTRLIVVSEE